MIYRHLQAYGGKSFGLHLSPLSKNLIFATMALKHLDKFKGKLLLESHEEYEVNETTKVVSQGLLVDYSGINFFGHLISETFMHSAS